MMFALWLIVALVWARTSFTGAWVMFPIGLVMGAVWLTASVARHLRR